ncbi:MAG: Fic family protein [Candidatus Pacearchaeota archaeon]|nr:Fic family protein [Candidatus Pacearchaeota archaeon]
MVTKYDIFELVYKYKHPIKPIEILKLLNKDEREYDNILRILTELANEKLLVKTGYGFQASRTDKAKILYDIIYHCLSNDLNYNEILDKNIAEFINQALQIGEINSKSIKLNPRTVKKYVEILSKNGLILIIAEKPLRAKIFYNTLLNNIFVYFGYKKEVIAEYHSNYLMSIEKELAKFRKLRKGKEVKYKQILEDFEISFIHHSLALEGNPITLPQTRRILRDKIIPSNLRSEDVDEVKNYQKALTQMLLDSQNKKPLTIQTILNYHTLAMQHNSEIAGRTRKIQVHIKGNPNFRIAKVEKIEDELNKLLEDYNKFIKKKSNLKEILNFAVYFHNEFQHIHPFEDGNSRTTRLITFHLLQFEDIPIVDIPFGLLDEYLSYTKGSMKRDDTKLYQTLQKIILFNLKKINDKLSS